MRIAGLLALVILSPTFVHAAALVNINTADATLLDTLPGIGLSYAADIIAYREAHGLFATIEDIQKVSNIGSGSRYTNIAPFITVGDGAAPAATSTPDTASSTPSSASSSGSTTTYVPPPSTLSLTIRGIPDALLEVPLHFFAQVTAKNGAVDPAAHISWSFGDGSGGEGSAMEKTYRHAGTYLVVGTATDGSAIARDELIVTVKPAVVRIAALSGEGITLANDTDERLDLSGWRLSADAGSFRIPEGTTLLPQASVLFPSTITNLPVSLAATLQYPNGIVAARYTPPIAMVPGVAVEASDPIGDVQPSSLESSSSQVQTVESFTSTKTNVSYHAEAVSAPAPVSNKETGAGAAALLVPPLAAAVTPKTPATGLFHSPWTFSLLGVIALAGGAFILL